MLTQQGAQVPVEELLERAPLGNASNDSSLMATPLGSNLSVHCQSHVGYHCDGCCVCSIVHYHPMIYLASFGCYVAPMQNTEQSAHNQSSC